MNYVQHMKSLWSGPAWHGPDINEMLDGVDASLAGRRPHEDLRTIAEFVYHMIAWRTFAIEMLKGNYDYRIEVNSETDWKVIEGCSDEDWQELRSLLSDSQDTLLKLLENVSSDQLDTQAGDRPYTVRVIIEGVADHDLYHLGQIALIKKLNKK